MARYLCSVLFAQTLGTNVQSVLAEITVSLSPTLFHLFIFSKCWNITNHQVQLELEYSFQSLFTVGLTNNGEMVYYFLSSAIDFRGSIRGRFHSSCS